MKEEDMEVQKGIAVFAIGLVVIISFGIRFYRAEDLTETEIKKEFDMKVGHVLQASPADSTPPIAMEALPIGACARRCKAKRRCGGFAYHVKEKKCFYYRNDDLDSPLPALRSKSTITAFIRKA